MNVTKHIITTTLLTVGNQEFDLDGIVKANIKHGRDITTREAAEKMSDINWTNEQQANDLFMDLLAEGVPGHAAAHITECCVPSIMEILTPLTEEDIIRVLKEGE